MLEMITEDYVSFEIAKLLKEKGFKKWCDKCYGTAVCHKGVPISFDEECDLESEGRGDEIEYIEGGCLYNFGCDNTEEETNLWAAPTLWVAMKWLREVHKCFIEIKEYFDIKQYQAFVSKYGKTAYCEPDWFHPICNSYEEACEAAIKYYLENLI